jgi:hypothetical protein
MMINSISRQTIDGHLQTIGQVLSGIERGGGVVHLRDLGLLLIEATGLLERNPGLREAHERFSSRMRRAGAQIRPERLNAMEPALHAA